VPVDPAAQARSDTAPRRSPPRNPRSDVLMPVRTPVPTPPDAYPPDLWTKCPAVRNALQQAAGQDAEGLPELRPSFRISAKRDRAARRPRSFVERDADLTPSTPSGRDLKPYPDRLMAAQLASAARCRNLGRGRDGRQADLVVRNGLRLHRRSMGSWWAKRWPEPVRRHRRAHPAPHASSSAGEDAGRHLLADATR